MKNNQVILEEINITLICKKTKVTSITKERAEMTLRCLTTPHPVYFLQTDFFVVEVWRGASLNEETVSGPSSVFSLVLRPDTATSSLIGIDKSNASYTFTSLPRDRLNLTSDATAVALWSTVLSPSFRTPFLLFVITISRIHGVIVFAVGAYEGKTDMNGKSEWMNQDECIRITIATGFFTVRGRGGAETERERERQDQATGSETGHLVHPARRVYKLSNLVDKSVPGLFFVPSGCIPSPLLRECIPLYTCRSVLANDNSRRVERGS